MDTFGKKKLGTGLLGSSLSATLGKTLHGFCFSPHKFSVIVGLSSNSGGGGGGGASVATSRKFPSLAFGGVSKGRTCYQGGYTI